jgi:hypothetical protein
MARHHLAICGKKHLFRLNTATRHEDWKVYCPVCGDYVFYGDLGQERETFISRDDLTVGRADEFLYYGPESAKAYRKVSVMHLTILAQRDRAIEQLLPIRRALKSEGYTVGDINRNLARSHPDLWEDLHPWRKLDRAGYDVIHDAAERDTDTYFTVLDATNEPPWEPCRSPREAHERYGLAT